MQLLGEIKSKNGKNLVLNFKAMVVYEEISGESIFTLIDSFGNGTLPKLSSIRDLVYAALVTKHPDATVEDAYEILNEESDIFYRLIGAAMPKAEDEPQGEEATKKKTVSKARTGTRP